MVSAMLFNRAGCRRAPHTTLDCALGENTLNIKRNVSKKCFVFLFRQKVIEYACSYEKVDKTQQKYNITKEK